MNRRERTLVVAIGLSLILVAAQGLLAYFSGSLALKAEAWHVLADFVVGLITLGGMRLARRETSVSKTGVSLVENVIAILIGLFVLYVGFDIIRTVATEQPELRNLGWVIAGSVLTIALAWIIARYEMYVGRQTQSPSLIATAHHDMLDVYAHVVVLFGLIGATLGFTNLDRLAALLVVFFVAHSSYDILSIAILSLRKRRSILEMHEHREEGALSQARTGQRARALIPAVAVIVVIFYLLSGFYTVGPGEEAIVRRFGRVVATRGPGLHYHLPWPADYVDRISVSQVRRIELPRALMITGDENLVVSSLGVHYTIKDAESFLFHQGDPEAIVSEAADAAIRRVVAEEPVDAILTGEKDLIEEQAARIIQATLDAYESGVQVIDVRLLEANPPPEVADAFRDVASAREDMNTYINEAQAYENEQVALARGESFKILETAKVYWIDKASNAVGESVRFLFQRHAYVESPDVTRQRLYLEAVEKVLRGAKKYLIDPRVELAETDLWFTEMIESLP